MKRVREGKPPLSRAPKPTIAELRLKERGILRPEAVRPLNVGPSVGSGVAALFPQNSTAVRIGGNGVFASRTTLPQHAMVVAFEASMQARDKRKSLDCTDAEGI